MANDEGSASWNWGGPPAPPSARRVDPRGWLCASLVAGVAAAIAALMAAWRPIPGLALPQGALGLHASYWARLALHAVGPHLFVQSSSEYAAFWSALPFADRVGVIVRCAFGSLAAIATAILLAKPMLHPRDGLIELRGSRRIVGEQAVAALVGALKARVKRRPDHEIAPGVAYPAELWTRGTLIAGGVGSGKSTALRPLIDKVVKANEQMLLFDAKSEFTSGWKSPALIAPWDARSFAWDIARDFRNALEMERFAASMIRESADPMWSSASRQVLVGAMLHLRGTRGVDWGWSELRDVLTLPQPSLLGIMEDWHPLAARSLARASVTSAGILINLMSFCAPIFHLAEAWGAHPASRRLSIVEWTLGRSRHKQIVLQGHLSYGELAKPLAEGIVGVFASLVASVEMSDDLHRKIWFIADEVIHMGKLPMEVFSMGRSRGVRAVIATQDFAQLEAIHGAPAVKALVSMVGTMLVGQTMQGESADLLCKAFGTREVERANVSTPQGGSGPRGSTLSFSRDEVHLYKPSELASRLGLSPDGGLVTLILFTGGVAYELSWPLFNMRNARPAHIAAAWTRGDRHRLAIPRGSALSDEAGAPMARHEGSSPNRQEPLRQCDASFDDELEQNDGSIVPCAQSLDLKSDAWLFGGGNVEETLQAENESMRLR